MSILHLLLLLDLLWFIVISSHITVKMNVPLDGSESLSKAISDVVCILTLLIAYLPLWVVIEAITEVNKGYITLYVVSISILIGSYGCFVCMRDER